MTDERPNPDIFFTDEEVAEMKAKGIISEDKPVSTPTVCHDCGRPIKVEDGGLCDSCIPF